MSAEALALYSGIALSLVFSYIPGLNKEFNGLQPNRKRLVMLGALVLTALIVFGIGCSGWLDVGITCDQAGVVALLQAFVLALIANQSAYAISPKRQ